MAKNGPKTLESTGKILRTWLLKSHSCLLRLIERDDFGCSSLELYSSFETRGVSG